MAEYGEWNQKGATFSDVTAQKEFGVTREFIETGIRAGKLEYRHGSVWGQQSANETRFDFVNGGTLDGLLLRGGDQRLKQVRDRIGLETEGFSCEDHRWPPADIGFG